MSASDLTPTQLALLMTMTDGDVCVCSGSAANVARNLHLSGYVHPEGHNRYRISEAGREALSRVRSRQALRGRQAALGYALSRVRSRQGKPVN